LPGRQGVGGHRQQIQKSIQLSGKTSDVDWLQLRRRLAECVAEAPRRLKPAPHGQPNSCTGISQTLLAYSLSLYLRGLRFYH